MALCDRLQAGLTTPTAPAAVSSLAPNAERELEAAE
jgi:hypothetical protein